MMNNKKDLKIGEFIHGAEIQVSKEGTSASTTTTVEVLPKYPRHTVATFQMFSLSSFVSLLSGGGVRSFDIVPPQEIVFDKPFFFLLYDKNHLETPLFFASVQDPTVE